VPLLRIFCKSEEGDNKMKVTERERKLLVREIAARCKDAVFMNSEEEVSSCFGVITDALDNPTKEITFEFRYKFLGNDFRQMLGRCRRTEQKKMRKAKQT